MAEGYLRRLLHERGLDSIRVESAGVSGWEDSPATPEAVQALQEKGIDVGRTRLSAVVEGFNLLGTAHEVEEDVLTGAGFRTPTAQQPPRALRLGLRLDF